MSDFNDLEELDNQLLQNKEGAEGIIEKREKILQNLNPILKKNLDQIDIAYLEENLTTKTYIEERKKIVNTRTKFRLLCLEQDLGLLDNVITAQQYLERRKRLLKEYITKLPEREISETDRQFLNGKLVQKEYINKRIQILKNIFGLD